jgi:hypothetical protein
MMQIVTGVIMILVPVVVALGILAREFGLASVVMCTVVALAGFVSMAVGFKLLIDERYRGQR